MVAFHWYCGTTPPTRRIASEGLVCQKVPLATGVGDVYAVASVLLAIQEVDRRNREHHVKVADFRSPHC